MVAQNDETDNFIKVVLALANKKRDQEEHER